MKFFVPPAGGLFCFRRPQSAPPAKPASRASQQTPSSAFGKSQARRSPSPPSPKVGKAPLSRRTRAPKGSPVLLEEAPPPSQEAPAATKRQSPRPKASGRPPYGKQAVRELRSRPRKTAPNGGFPNAGTQRTPKGGNPPPDIPRGIAVSQNAANAREAARGLPRVSRRTSAPRGSKPRRKTAVRQRGAIECERMKVQKPHRLRGRASSKKESLAN